MSLLEGCWFLITVLLTSLIVLIDPKNYALGSSVTNAVSNFSSPSSRQDFILNLSNVLIALFFTLTLILKYLGY
jgi:preprotein translocase subunit SecG